MSNGIKLFIAFATGAAAGSVVAWKLLEKKYADIAQAEIDSVKEVFSKMNDYDEVDEQFENSVEPMSEEEFDKKQYKDIIREHYGNFEDLKKGGSESVDGTKPVIISPEEFKDIDETEYDILTLTYWNDRVLTNEFNEIVEDAPELIGDLALDSFGDYETDSVFVRNDELGCAYEILLDVRNYKETLDDTDD